MIEQQLGWRRQGLRIARADLPLTHRPGLIQRGEDKPSGRGAAQRVMFGHERNAEPGLDHARGWFKAVHSNAKLKRPAESRSGADHQLVETAALLRADNVVLRHFGESDCLGVGQHMFGRHNRHQPVGAIRGDV